jgi:hypothetical protein
MEMVYMSGVCDVCSHFMRQFDGKYPVNGIAFSSYAEPNASRILARWSLSG